MRNKTKPSLISKEAHWETLVRTEIKLKFTLGHVNWPVTASSRSEEMTWSDGLQVRSEWHNSSLIHEGYWPRGYGLAPWSPGCLESSGQLEHNCHILARRGAGEGAGPTHTDPHLPGMWDCHSRDSPRHTWGWGWYIRTHHTPHGDWPATSEIWPHYYQVRHISGLAVSPVSQGWSDSIKPNESYRPQ